jgi:hypothetical protein
MITRYEISWKLYKHDLKLSRRRNTIKTSRVISSGRMESVSNVSEIYLAPSSGTDVDISTPMMEAQISSETPDF